MIRRRVRAEYLVVAELLAEGGEQVAQLGGRDEAVAVLVEVTQPLDEVVGGVAAARLRDGLHMHKHADGTLDYASTHSNTTKILNLDCLHVFVQWASTYP